MIIMDEFDNLVNELQEYVDQKDQNDFSPYALELSRNPYHLKSLSSGSNVFIHNWQGPCGDSICWYLHIEGSFIKNAFFTTSGCMTSIIAGSQTAKMIHQQDVANARNLTHNQVLQKIGKFPKKSHHCITLALTSLSLTLDLYENSISK